jgi:SAM-dependent methyltransferase
VTTLDLGCGPNKTPGAFGVDAHPFDGVDLVHDLDVLPWPLADGSYDRIVAHHIIEHVADAVAFMREIHRVAAPGAHIEIVTPHFSNRSVYVDPTHRRAFSVRTFDLFTGTPPTKPCRVKVGLNYLLEYDYAFQPLAGLPAFSRVSLHLSFPRLWRWCGLQWLVSRTLDFYEFHLAGLLPARDITAVIRVDKEPA